MLVLVAHTFQGRCHCGNVAVTFETETEPEALPLRECGCTFCRRHCARTTSDPEGSVVLQVHVASMLSRYEFGLRVGEMWVCARCGVYVAAVMREGNSAFASVNVRCLEDEARFTATPQATQYDDEDAAARRSRRKYLWTPVKGSLPV
jgi:hypothetical protein